MNPHAWKYSHMYVYTHYRSIVILAQDNEGLVFFLAGLVWLEAVTIPELLKVMKDWMANDGTFLYTYHGNMRLGLDQDCPLEIASFSQPECVKNTNVKYEL